MDVRERNARLRALSQPENGEEAKCKEPLVLLLACEQDPGPFAWWRQYKVPVLFRRKVDAKKAF
jgi:hypothetical protein